MKYNRQFEEIIQKLLPIVTQGDADSQLQKDILTLVEIYRKKDERLNRIIKLSDKQQMAIIELNEELDDYKNNLEVKVKEEIEKRKAQEELLIEQSRLAAIAEMFDAVAHQWTQPLNVLSMQVDILNIEAMKKGSLPQEKITQFKENASMQIIHMSQTLENFRKFFKPMDHPEPFSVETMIQGALSLVKNELIRARISLHFDISEDFQIIGNESEFKHIILNLINNAKYALRENNISNPYIKIRVTGERHSIEVTDNAGGIPEEIIDDIFKLHCTTKGKEGSGIGLYMSTKIAQKHHGELFAENTNEGAKFTFILKDAQ
jgi:signal transduction histidine kinase